jgi:hypothetical protein
MDVRLPLNYVYCQTAGRVGIVGYSLARLDGRRPKNMDETHVITITEKSTAPQPSSAVIWAQVWMKLALHQKSGQHADPSVNKTFLASF